MLPSNEFFKHIFCPYDKAKLCHRPYCHYKHAETGSVENPLVAVEETEYLFDSKPATNTSEFTRSTYTPDFDSAYVPSPVVKPVGILKVNNRNNNYSSFYNSTDTMVIPEYNPTPISRLQELNPSNSAHATTFPSYRLPDARKKKNTEEYDPTMVKLKCTSKKSVMFADEAGIALDDSCAPNFSSSEEDMDDTGSAPKFSDDDLDDYSHAKISRQVPKPDAKPQEDETEEEDILDEKSIDEFSLVDKILVGSKKSDKYISNFKKSVLMPKEKKTKSVKGSKKPVESKKSKAQVETDNVYDCEVSDNVVPSKPKKISDFDAIISMASFDDLQDNETNDKEKSSKKMSSKTIELPRTKKSPELEARKEKSEVHKSKTSSSDKKSKETSHTSKHSEKSTDSKTKHSSSSDKSKLNSKLDKSEKHKSVASVSSKSDKSSLNNKLSKSDKTKTSSHSSKSDKSSSKTSKSDTVLSSKTKFSKDREAKLQDEQVTSSSIAKKMKYDQSLKNSSKHPHTESSKLSLSKSSFSKEDKSKSKVMKRKADDSDDESLPEKSKFKSKKYKNDSDDDDDMSSVDGGVDDIIDISSESEDDTEEQCKRIFEETFVPNEESVPSDKEDSSSSKRPTFVDMTFSQKQRLAHAGATTTKKSGPVRHVNPTRHPGQVMLDRFANIRAAQAELNERKEKGHVSNNSPGRGKTRISIAPNHSLIAALAEKNRLNNSSHSFSPLPSTVSKTLKVTKRVAHIPDVAVKPRPVIPIDYGSKVPTVVRQKFLNAFIDEYLKLAASEDESYENALEEEKNAYGRSSSKAIYMNVASNALNRLRHRVAETATAPAKKSGVVSSTTKSSKKTVSHETLLNGPQAQRTSFSIERKKAAPTPELKGLALYEHLTTYVLSEEELKENGYPFPHPSEMGRAVIEGIYADRIKYCNDPFKRTCCRCSKIYYVNVDGDYVRDEECDYHWGRLFQRRIAGNRESRYMCCQGDSEADGCCVGKGHVFEGSESHALKGFVSTLPKSPPPDNYYGIYALDCEMCHTTAGNELTRISVIGPDLKPVYETFVKPQNKILDFNTRFSGITEEDLKNVRTNIRDVQAVLLCMFNTRTILIGHSLESDLKALKLFHKTVVDTSVVFPHKLGLPYKRALRNLSSEKLNKIIQNDVGGHDSAEDAVASMELMLYKLKEDLKVTR